MIIGVIATLFIATYWGLYCPIMNMADAYDANLLTATLVATEIFKILIREILATIVFWICMIFGFSLLH